MRYSFVDNAARIQELQPWGPGLQEESVLRPDTASKPDWIGIVVGGASDQDPAVTYRGRVADFAVFNKDLAAAHLAGLAAASQPEDPADVPDHRPGALDEEGRVVLLEDYERLTEWHRKGQLDGRDLREAATLAHLWILDRYPLLQRASDHFGAMLSLPDVMGNRALVEEIEKRAPAFWWTPHIHQGDWVPLRVFRDDMACWLGQAQQRVTWAAFIKFVRNKLGGGHFDPDDRRRWQKELNELTRKTEIDGEPWLAALTLTLVRSLIISVEGCGFISLAREASQ